MDFDSINNCMSDQQKLSLSAASLSALTGGSQTYDDINNKMNDHEKLSLIASALTQLDGGSGAILPLSDYLDVSSLTVLTDKDGLISAIEDGNGFYMVDPNSGLGLILYGAIDDDTIKLFSFPALADQQLMSFSFAFDKNTGTLDPTKTGVTGFAFPNHTTIDSNTILGLGKLTINIGSNTYEYDGSQDVNITILDGESMGF